MPIRHRRRLALALLGAAALTASAASSSATAEPPVRRPAAAQSLPAVTAPVGAAPDATVLVVSSPERAVELVTAVEDGGPGVRHAGLRLVVGAQELR